MLAWSPRYGLDEALVETIAWYRQHLGAGRDGARRYAA